MFKMNGSLSTLVTSTMESLIMVTTSATLSTNLEDVSSSMNSSKTINYTFCGPGLQEFRPAYARVHGYLSLIVCLFGSVANVLNIAVLSRREMRSPTNAILTGLAVADLLVMLDYIPYAGHMYLSHNSRSRLDNYSYGWSMFVLFHSIFSQVCHTISIWLTVTLAVWRYIAVAYPQKNREWCRMEVTMTTILSAYIVCPIICIPLYLTFTLHPSTETFTSNGHKYNSTTYNETVDGPTFNATIYFVNYSKMALLNNNLLKNLYFWVYSVVIKIIPCIALTVLSMRLICALLETKRRRQQLSGANIPLTSLSENGDCKVAKKHKKNARLLDKERQTDRTTRMLLAILLLFLITEFPQGILGVLSITLGHQFFIECYFNLGEVMDILALINSAINFILYCAMSRQFRTTFASVFGCSRDGQGNSGWFGRWLPVALAPSPDAHTTGGGVTQVTQV